MLDSLSIDPGDAVLTSECRFSEVMSHPVTTFEINESVGHVVNVLKKDLHEGFPIVEQVNSQSVGVVPSLKWCLVMPDILNLFPSSQIS